MYGKIFYGDPIENFHNTLLNLSPNWMYSARGVAFANSGTHQASVGQNRAFHGLNNLTQGYL